MKRYDMTIAKDRMIAIKEQHVYLVADVSRETIPRPDAEAAKKALETLIDAAKTRDYLWEKSHLSREHGDRYRAAQGKYDQALAEVLRLMGVE